MGNSDPFDAYAIPIGPVESYLLNEYLKFVIPEGIREKPGSIVYVGTAYGRTYYEHCLKDEASAYALLARNESVMNQARRNPYAAETASVLGYMAKSQAALQKRLPLVNGSENPELLCTIMWAASFLATIEIALQTSNVQIHMRAVIKMILRYVELKKHELDAALLIYPMFTASNSALMTAARPAFDMYTWFPRVFQDTWTKAKAFRRSGARDPKSIYIHHDVRDTTTRTIIARQWEALDPVHLHGTNLCTKDELLLMSAAASLEMFYHGQLLNIAADAMQYIERPGLTFDQVQDEAAKAYIPFATLLWMHVRYLGSLGRKTFGVVTPIVLRRLQNAMKKSGTSPTMSSQQPERYAVAKLWAISMGVCAESQRQMVLGLDPACGSWFFEAFRKQVHSMQIQSWQQASSVLGQILYNDRVRPHISEWWYLVFPSHVRSSTDSDEWQG